MPIDILIQKQPQQASEEHSWYVLKI
jgi:hypothetical protein